MSEEITFVLVRTHADGEEWFDAFTAVPCKAGGYTLCPSTQWDGTTRLSYTNLAPYWRPDRASAEAELERVCRERAERIRERPEDWEDDTADMHIEVCMGGYVVREVAL